jgi:hypothetical protein
VRSGKIIIGRMAAAANPEEVFKIVCGRDEIRHIFEVGLDGEQKTLESAMRS